jgi:gluconolactonase
MKRVFPSLARHSVCPLLASLALGLVACAAADDADDAPSFEPPPFAGAGQGAPPPGVGTNAGGNGPTGAAGQAGQPPAGPSGTGGTSPVSGNSGEGNAGSLGLGAGGSVNAGVGNGSAGSGAASGGSASTPAQGTAGASMVGVGGSADEPPLPGEGPGRVGAEFCPPGPFGAPLPANPAVQRLFTLDDNGFFNFEGPVWTGNALYFSEISGGNNPPPARINRYVPGVPGFERGVIENSGSNGMALDAAGNLIAATHDVGAISTFQVASGARGTFGAQSFNGQRFNSPNDLVLRGDGNVYFTDPSFQAPGNPQGATRVYRIDPTGAASVVDGTLGNPNGITLSPDGNTLYVTSSQGLRRYALAADGTPDAGAAIPLQQGLQEADGMAMDCAGNIYTTEHGARRIRVFDPEGNQLASFGGQGTFANNVTNLAFGGPNRTTLFITTLAQNGGGVYSVEAGVPGLPY